MKVFAYYPRGTQTGGPEALHQFVDAANSIGYEAYLVPIETSKHRDRVKAYSHYNCPEADRVDDEPGNLVIAYETHLEYLSGVKNALRAIWWLSIDNSPLFRPERAIHNSSSILRGLLTSTKSVLQNSLHLTTLRGIVDAADFHYAQSNYAADYLRNRRGINAAPLTDYIYVHEDQSTHGNVTVDRHSIKIAYNTKKSEWELRPLIKRRSDFEWIGIQRMTPRQVAETLKKADIYIDFGPHPGKDRLPREAALAESIVIVGDRGSGRFDGDVPIPDHLRVAVVNRQRRRYTQDLELLLDEVIPNAEYWVRSQDHYRERILGEKDKFFEEVHAVLQHASPR
jgi:hypothetical protein